MIEKAKALLLFHEGKRRHAYLDTLGFTTIGVGRNIDQRSGPGLRDSEIDLMLRNDVEAHMHQLVAAVPFFLHLSEVRQVILLDMCHQLGLSGLLKFKRMLDALSRSDYEAAAVSMRESKWRRQTPNRARRLAAMMTTNRYPEDVP